MSKAGYELEFEDTFDGGSLDEGRWIPHYLSQWSSRERSVARYTVGGGCLRLLIEADQQPWCPEYDGAVKVSSLQTGMFAGPVGTTIGQQRFNPDAVVREAQQNARLYLPQYGLIEMRAKAIDDPRNMVALWMIGYEDEPHAVPRRSACARSSDAMSARITPRSAWASARSPTRTIVDGFSDRDGRDRRSRVPRLRGRVDAGARRLHHRRGGDQDRRAVAGLSDAAHARHLRVPSGDGVRAERRRLSQGVHRRLRAGISPVTGSSCGREQVRDAESARFAAPSNFTRLRSGSGPVRWG